MLKRRIKIKASNSNFWPKISYYKSDGSGRDSYIKCNEGGFQKYAKPRGLR